MPLPGGGPEATPRLTAGALGRVASYATSSWTGADAPDVGAATSNAVSGATALSAGGVDAAPRFAYRRMALGGVAAPDFALATFCFSDRS